MSLLLMPEMFCGMSPLRDGDGGSIERLRGLGGGRPCLSDGSSIAHANDVTNVSSKTRPMLAS